MDNQSLLLVDDDPHVLKSLYRELNPAGYRLFTAASAKEGLEIVKQHDIGVVLSDMSMPEMDGIAFLEAVAVISEDTVRVLLTGYGSHESAIAAINRTHIFGYLTKPWTPENLQATLAKAFAYANLRRENKRLQQLTTAQNEQLRFINEHLESLVRERTAQLEEAVNEGIEMLALAAEAKDDVTGEHIYRIRELTLQICSALGISEAEAEQISFFSVIHDIGKIRIPDSILKKKGPLTEEEWQIMQTHTRAGEKILGNKPFYLTARLIARSHHEKWDGSGYPDGLRGEEIPLASRIVAVADVFDSLTHERPYKARWSVAEALAFMETQRGIHFDPKVLDVFLQLRRKD
ncbi:MAG: response regulator [Desulfurivibrio sp.]|jgi:putative two-component system response regulator|nr:MAG: response regulator [Desulfurivibrio sp.]